MIQEITNTLHLFFAGFWPTIWHLALGSSIFVACLVAAVFLPIFRVNLLWAAAVIALLLVSFEFGITDEHRRCVAHEAVLTKQFRDALAKAQRHPPPRR